MTKFLAKCIEYAGLVLVVVMQWGASELSGLSAVMALMFSLVLFIIPYQGIKLYRYAVIKEHMKKIELTIQDG